ncbi:MBL fold metallo-hydrolase [Tunturiibacter gelidoferens]|uniref:L-ascorbate metabolism protein UlaG (Beta-lactamase superfamily) n=1 Tax=Tunturiibacter gelidiferens TaxID=3069689 RepID=A0ACC5P3B5_9BACT|nr:MBL fold metallo-hydrolase [Edaphobacter lichenicola]MBB5341327.1 L-ascorbate metabolism protein UlaG (beta-lactamase superfamily) [Edaphobacter lichenicola]
MQRAWRARPFAVRKMEQLWRLVRESHEQPMTGTSRPVELVRPNELGVTFIGHSSFLLQVYGRKLLVDPVFSKRLIVLRRQRRPGVVVDALPAIDIVLLTHAHMDHLDMASLRRVIRATRKLTGQTPEVIVPRGVEDLVERLGFSRIHGLAWWEQIEVQGLKVTMTPCKHWGARMFRDTHRGYGGYVVEGGGQSVYHSGDTAYFDGFSEIGARLRPEVALLPIGAYFPDSYRSVHTSPEEALRGFVDLGAQQMVPMHYGTFCLGREPMEEPLQRLELEAERLGIEGKLKILAEGETMHLCPATSIR